MLRLGTVEGRKSVSGGHVMQCVRLWLLLLCGLDFVQRCALEPHARGTSVRRRIVGGVGVAHREFADEGVGTVRGLRGRL